MSKSTISYLRRGGSDGFTWNPVTGCSPCSPGCDNCWAKRMAESRLRGRCGYDQDDPFKVTFHPDRLHAPFKLHKPSMIAVCFMGDLFHPKVRREWLDQILEVISDCPQHTFLMLTKRPENIKPMLEAVHCIIPDNVWLGATICNQSEADVKIPQLLEIPAAVHWISIEPMLGPVDLEIPYEGVGDLVLDTTLGVSHLDWVVVGCEKLSGHRPGRRMNLDWANEIVRQCRESMTPAYMKQVDVDGCVTSDMKKFPWYLQIRQMPDSFTKEKDNG